VFLSHNWGSDGLNRNNHERVRRFKDELERRDLKVWFDENFLPDGHDINREMAKGIQNSKVGACVCVCVCVCGCTWVWVCLCGVHIHFLHSVYPPWQLFLVFVTNNYMLKIEDKTGKDNCGIEFDMALNKWGRQRMLPIIMEHNMNMRRQWTGKLAMLANQLTVDYTTDEREKLQRAAQEVVNKVRLFKDA
jgi:hypothetical protein